MYVPSLVSALIFSTKHIARPLVFITHCKRTAWDQELSRRQSDRTITTFHSHFSISLAEQNVNTHNIVYSIMKSIGLYHKSL